MNKTRMLQFSRAKIFSNTLFGRIAGFTVVELLVALILAGLITSASLALYLTQQKQLMVQSDISDIQGGLRAAAGELTTRIRMAGYKLPEGFPCVITKNTNPDTIEVISNTNTLDGVQIEHAMPTPSSELRCDGHDVSGVHTGDTLYIYDPVSLIGEFFSVSQVQESSSNIQHNDWSLSRCYPQGSIIIRALSYKYYIDSTDPLHPNLVFRLNGNAPQVYAENITNLNIQYLLSSGVIVDTAPSAYLIREAIITLSGRTDKIDSEFFTPYRNRTLTTRVKIRNLGDN
ncbi:MAG TPA: hypothetical protein DCZ43_00740 [candidate division Zixibacteria bacterium]|nr:hypothetical protein [candidate division Zixibacteria bacterium]